MNYRFKTEEEFKAIYGSDWRMIIENKWNRDMDKYLGKSLTEEEYRQIISDPKKAARLDRFDRWAFSPSMVISEDAIKEVEKSVEKADPTTLEIDLPKITPITGQPIKFPF